MNEPTLTDVLSVLDRLESDLKDLRTEVRVGQLENRASIADLRATVADLRAETRERHDELRTRLVTLFDEVAAFRAEYNAHTHGDGTSGG